VFGFFGGFSLLFDSFFVWLRGGGVLCVVFFFFFFFVFCVCLGVGVVLVVVLFGVVSGGFFFFFFVCLVCFGWGVLFFGFGFAVVLYVGASCRLMKRDLILVPSVPPSAFNLFLFPSRLSFFFPMKSPDWMVVPRTFLREISHPAFYFLFSALGRFRNPISDRVIP